MSSPIDHSPKNGLEVMVNKIKATALASCASSAPAFVAQKYRTSFFFNTPCHINDGFWSSVVGSRWGVKCKRGDHDNALSPTTDVVLSPTDAMVAKENVAYSSHEQYFTEHIHIDNMNKITGVDGDIDDNGDAL
jgi:hypothetical protein